MHDHSYIYSVSLQVLDESKLQQVDSLHKEFETPEKANKVWVKYLSLFHYLTFFERLFYVH